MNAGERFWRHVLIGNDCWEWTASRQRNGYGQFHPEHDRKALAHRFAHELLVGPIPAGMQLDHLCRNRACVRPDHLEVVTSAENTRRSPIAVGALNALKTQCPAGHLYDEANTHLRPDGRRLCRACDRGRKATSVAA